MHCPSCKGGMEVLPLANHIGSDVAIDVCWLCHVIWFDHLESTSLSAASVIGLFKRIHEARDVADSAARHTLNMAMRCPSCAGGLKLINDLGKNGRFSYYGCPVGEGHAITFTQFLREKNFIRTLKTWEIKTLSAHIKQIRCSSCGGPINLEHDPACAHCGAAISVLDRDAVEKALAALAEKDATRLHAKSSNPSDIDAMIEAALQRARHAEHARTQSQSAALPLIWLAEAATWGDSTDLVAEGIGELLSGLFDL